MTSRTEPSNAAVRWSVYWLLIAIAAAQMTARILAVNSVDLVRLQERKIADALAASRQRYVSEGVSDEVLADRLSRREAELRSRLQMERPFLSANDRSRWCTIRALVEYGTYAIDPIVTDPDQRRRWDTIDMIKHDRSGQPHLYSSKPTLLPTLLAAEYWLIRAVTGWTLADDPHVVVRIMLITVNVMPMVAFFYVLALLVERLGRTDWGRILVMAAATFGTFLTTFAVALNNHLIAAISAAFALYATVRIMQGENRRARWFVMAGFFSAFAAANDLPALLLLVFLGAALLWQAPRGTLLFGLPAVLVVAAAALGTNYAAHSTIVPPYAFRVEGEDWQGNNWYNYSYQVGDREVSSYWKRDAASMARRSVNDRGEPSMVRYALHCVVGHHGILSLTPLWLLSCAGVVLMLCDRGGDRLRPLGILILVITVVCLSFYIGQSPENRNYGGVTSGLRWMFWCIPLWLIALLPAADWASAARGRRALALVLLAFSVLSASYPTWNPWTHPWIAQWMHWLGWIEL